MKQLVWISIAGMLVLHPLSVQAQTLQAPSNLNLSVTSAEAELIWKAIRKLPVEEVEPLMNKLRQQVIEQTIPKNPVDKKAD